MTPSQYAIYQALKPVKQSLYKIHRALEDTSTALKERSIQIDVQYATTGEVLRIIDNLITELLAGGEG